jgi:GNAT superfamily N-acetyltransferase
MHLDCNCFYIHDLEIYLKYRNNGYGHILMEQIEKYAIQNNKNRLFLKVFPELTNAVKLYEDCNFEIVHNDGFIIEMEKFI